MENVLLAISLCLPMHYCSVADIPICNRSFVSFSTAAMHFPNTYKLIRKIELRKNVHKCKKPCNLKANTKALNVRTFY